MRKSIITNIQKFSIHDGDGIRTTIFFKGCPLSCAWCHNPETRNFTPELLYNKEKCLNCLVCIHACSKGSIFWDEKTGIHTLTSLCTCCGACVEACLSGAREIAGTPYSVQELMHQINKDAMFYEQSGGGVTLSGGEAMAADMDFVADLLQQCKNRGYRVNIDTCGYAPFENFKRILKLVDVFLYDLKVMDPEKHRKYTGRGNDVILNNLIGLSDAGSEIHIRMPLIEGVNTSDEDIGQALNFLKTLHIKRIYLLPYHDTGRHKAERLGLETSPGMKAPSAGRLDDIAEKFRNNGYDTRIGG